MTDAATITWDDFMRVDLRVGRIVSARVFEQARKPAYVLEVDFGPEIGLRKSSARSPPCTRPRNWSDGWWWAWSTSRPGRSAR